MRKTVLALLSAALILAGSAWTVSASSTQTGGGTYAIERLTNDDLGTVGSLAFSRWTEVITFDGTVDGTAACTVHGVTVLGAQGPSSLRFVGWCRFSGDVGGRDGTAAGPSIGRITFAPFGGSIGFSLLGGSGELAGLRLTGNAQLDGTYDVTYRFAGG